MPIFEYICQHCQHRFEAIVLGSKKAACPKCESKRLTQQISSFAVAGSDKSHTTDSVAPCGACGDPRGPGACSMSN